MAEPDRTNADAERMSDIVARLRDMEVGYRPHVVGKALAEAADIIEAQSKALAEAREVKPLEWFDNSKWWLQADTPVGHYVVAASRASNHPGWYWRLNDSHPIVKSSEAEAKMAAQMDYEARILSALTPTPENSNG